MALYRNIAGGQVGLVQDYFTMKSEDNSQDGYYPSGGPQQAQTFNTGGLQASQLQTAALPMHAEGPTTFFDPWYVDNEVTAAPVAANPGIDWHAPADVAYPPTQIVYDVRKDEPITQIAPVPVAATIETQAPAPVQYSANVVNQPNKKNIFPLLTLAFLYANMISGERFLNGYKKIAFVGGLGALFLQFKNQAGDNPAT